MARRDNLRTIVRAMRIVVAGVLVCVIAAGPPAPLVSPRVGLGSPPAISSRAMSAGRIVSPMLPLRFEANRGQVDPRVQFLARGNGYTLLLTPGEATLALPTRQAHAEIESVVLRMRFLGANPRAAAGGEQESRAKTHYFIGLDPQKWLRNVPAFARVRYEDIYPGVDLIYEGAQGQLEYDLLVAPGSDLGAIRLNFEGADSLSLNATGDLIIRVAGGRIVQHVPTAYQESHGRREVIPARYVVGENGKVTFAVAAHDPQRLLVIDPVLTFSTYLGGSDYEGGHGIAVDRAGSIYVAGSTLSGDFPNKNATGIRGYEDVFVMKLSPDGREIIYVTFLGGAINDSANDIAVDREGSAYVAGHTVSSDFPTRNAFQPEHRGAEDGFVTKLSPDGSVLEFSTFLGGSKYDFIMGITVDRRESAYVTGFTYSADFPTKKPFRRRYKGIEDVFVTKFFPDGKRLVYSTYLGGVGQDFGRDIAVDGEGAAYVSGNTNSNDFPMKKSYQSTRIGLWDNDAFLAKVLPDGSGLAYSTYLGGSLYEYYGYVAVDRAGSAYVTGITESPDFPIRNAFQIHLYGNSDAYVAKFSPDGSTLVYSTYLGGQSADEAWGIAVDQNGRAHLTGTTGSSDFPTKSPFQPELGGNYDVFLTRFSADGSRLEYSTYLGGAGYERALGIALDRAGNVYLAGATDSFDFPTMNPLQPVLRGGADAFVAKVAR